MPEKRAAGGAWVALCASGERFDVVAVQRGGRPQVLWLEAYKRDGDEVDALKRIGRKHKLERQRCTSLLASADYQLLQTEQPAGVEGGAALREALRARVAEMIDKPIEHVGFDAVSIPTKELAPGRPQQAYVVVAGNAVIAPKVRNFHAAHIGLVAIDVPELAQRNVAALCETENRALAFLAFSEYEGLLTFTCNGELYMTRRIETGLKHLQTDDLERRSNLFDRIGLEVQRSLDNFDRQFGFLPLARLLLGPQAQALPLQGFLRDYLGITVDVLDLAEVIDFPKVPELRHAELQAQYLLAIGAALREELAVAS